MKNRLIEELNQSGRNWRQEIKNELAPAVIEELTQEHVEQTAGVEATEKFLNKVEQLLNCKIQDIQVVPMELQNEDQNQFIKEASKENHKRGLHGNFSSRENLHFNPQTHDPIIAPDVGGEAIVSGREPLHPSQPGKAILRGQLPLYSKELSIFKKGILGRILFKFGFLKTPEPVFKDHKINHLEINTWRGLLQEAEDHLHFYEFDLERHLKKEDDVLFPVIAKLGGAWEDISQDLEDQHAQQRAFIESCREYWTAATKSDNENLERHCLKFFRVLDTYLQHLIGHLDYEDNYVFEPAQAALSMQAKETLEQTWKKFKNEFQEPSLSGKNILEDE